MYRGLADGLGAVADRQDQIEEARRSMLYALTTADSNLQVEYVDKSRGADARVTTVIRRLATAGETDEARLPGRRARRGMGRLSARAATR